MDNDTAVFADFLEHCCGLTVVARRAHQETVTAFVNTCTALLATCDTEIDEFVKSTHAVNSAHSAAARILIPSSTVITLKAIRFELVADREHCGALPAVLANLQALTAIQVNYMRVQRTKSIAPDRASFAALSKLP